MTPFRYYQQQVESGLIRPDPQQQVVVEHLQRIYDDLLTQSRSGFLSRFRKRKPVKGLYVYGSVGVGKTFLMDCFYSCCEQRKLRMHFHAFLQRIHRELSAIQGQTDPLKKIARKIALEARVICFDEFFVANIADAMLLGGLFEALFAESVCLVTTSNVAPDDLYKEGLQRERFLPAITLIKQSTEVIAMLSHQDYRLSHSQRSPVYFSPLDEQAQQSMKSVFLRLAEGAKVAMGSVVVLGREIPARWHTDSMICFDFKVICGVPRSQNDYIEIAKRYHTVFVSEIPVLQSDQLNLTTAFIHLIDVFYDARVRLVLSAAASVECLYPVGKLRGEFARTQSRLIEMQSVDYFQHLSSL